LLDPGIKEFSALAGLVLGSRSKCLIKRLKVWIAFGEEVQLLNMGFEGLGDRRDLLRQCDSALLVAVYSGLEGLEGELLVGGELLFHRQIVASLPRGLRKLRVRCGQTIIDFMAYLQQDFHHPPGVHSSVFSVVIGGKTVQALHLATYEVNEDGDAILVSETLQVLEGGIWLYYVRNHLSIDTDIAQWIFEGSPITIDILSICDNEGPITSNVTNITNEAPLIYQYGVTIDGRRVYSVVTLIEGSPHINWHYETGEVVDYSTALSIVVNDNSVTNHAPIELVLDQSSEVYSFETGATDSVREIDLAQYWYRDGKKVIAVTLNIHLPINRTNGRVVRPRAWLVLDNTEELIRERHKIYHDEAIGKRRMLTIPKVRLANGARLTVNLRVEHQPMTTTSAT
jgi:hypothetical protein